MRKANDYHDAMFHVPKDVRYARMTADELKTVRYNMAMMGGYTKYEFALVQWWIMQKEGRLPAQLR